MQLSRGYNPMARYGMVTFAKMVLLKGTCMLMNRRGIHDELCGRASHGDEITMDNKIRDSGRLQMGSGSEGVQTLDSSRSDSQDHFFTPHS